MTRCTTSTRKYSCSEKVELVLARGSRHKYSWARVLVTWGGGHCHSWGTPSSAIRGLLFTCWAPGCKRGWGAKGEGGTPIPIPAVPLPTAHIIFGERERRAPSHSRRVAHLQKPLPFSHPTPICVHPPHSANREGEGGAHKVGGAHKAGAAWQQGGRKGSMNGVGRHVHAPSPNAANKARRKGGDAAQGEGAQGEAKVVQLGVQGSRTGWGCKRGGQRRGGTREGGGRLRRGGMNRGLWNLALVGETLEGVGRHSSRSSETERPSNGSTACCTELSLLFESLVWSGFLPNLGKTGTATGPQFLSQAQKLDWTITLSTKSNPSVIVPQRRIGVMASRHCVGVVASRSCVGVVVSQCRPSIVGHRPCHLHPTVVVLVVELDNPWLNRCRHLGLVPSLILAGCRYTSSREDSVMPLPLPPLSRNLLPMTMSVLDSPAGSPQLSGITGHNYNTGSSDNGDYEGQPPQQRNNSRWQGNDDNNNNNNNLKTRLRHQDNHNDIKTTTTARQDDGSRQQQQQDNFRSDDSDNANATCLFKQLRW
ncbi:hypothetical protein EDB89DRAFT_1909954 [Lactarius sanguifluus]|nr:hypothetical protein EDB89DRAFT_1909954 [Lactarius sanguifluus]